MLYIVSKKTVDESPKEQSKYEKILQKIEDACKECEAGDGIAIVFAATDGIQGDHHNSGTAGRLVDVIALVEMLPDTVIEGVNESQGAKVTWEQLSYGAAQVALAEITEAAKTNPKIAKQLEEVGLLLKDEDLPKNVKAQVTGPKSGYNFGHKVAQG